MGGGIMWWDFVNFAIEKIHSKKSKNNATLKLLNLSKTPKTISSLSL